MRENKTVFSDEEILNYGRANEMESSLLVETSQNPEFKRVADYVAASFVNPGQMIHVFGEIEGAFLRFRGALPDRDHDLGSTTEGDAAWTKNPGVALLISQADAGSMLACENRDTVIEMLLEMAGGTDTPEGSPLELEMDARDLLCLLASWDVVMENRYEGGWFTATSVLNAFDLWEDKDFSRICGPIGAIASDEIFKAITKADVENSLKGLAGEGILVADEIDGTRLYSFSMKYRNLYKLFEATSNRLAVASYQADGSVLLVYVIRNVSGSWAFEFEKGVGKIHRLSRIGLEKLCNRLID